MTVGGDDPGVAADAQQRGDAEARHGQRTEDAPRPGIELPQPVARVRAVGGRTLWRTRLGSGLNDADIVAGRLLVEGADGANSRDRLWELDPRTGRILGAVTVPGFSITALLRVGGDAWVVTADGHVIVVAP